MKRHTMFHTIKHKCLKSVFETLANFLWNANLRKLAIKCDVLAIKSTFKLKTNYYDALAHDPDAEQPLARTLHDLE